MPKQAANLKALNASLKILYNSRHKPFVSNYDFKKSIIKEMEFSETKDEAFLVKQSEMARYFGLIDYKFDRKQKISEKGIKFYESKNEEEKIAILFRILKFLSFGKNSAGVQDSNSNIDPPKLYLKTLLELEYITTNEFAVLLFRLHNENKTFRESIIEINKYREKNIEIKSTDIYQKIIKENLINKYTDPKFSAFFVFFNICVKKGSNYRLSQFIYNNYRKNISELSIYNDHEGLSSKHLKAEENINEQLNYHYINEEVLKKYNNRKPEIISSSNNAIKYKTNRRIADTVLKNRNYKCFFDEKHKTFLRMNEQQYMEAHHIVPMKAQKDFQDINIDREENILCLCPNCHRKAHYALESEKRTLLQKVYNLREKNLKRANIYISFKDLYKKYYWANTDIDLSFVKNQTQAKQAILIKEMLIQIAKEDKVNLTEEEIKIAADDLIIKYVKNN